MSDATINSHQCLMLIPQEILFVEVFGKLDPIDLLRLEATCQLFRDTLRNEERAATNFGHFAWKAVATRWNVLIDPKSQYSYRDQVLLSKAVYIDLMERIYKILPPNISRSMISCPITNEEAKRINALLYQRSKQSVPDWVEPQEEAKNPEPPENEFQIDYFDDPELRDKTNDKSIYNTFKSLLYQNSKKFSGKQLVDQIIPILLPHTFKMLLSDAERINSSLLTDLIPPTPLDADRGDRVWKGTIESQISLLSLGILFEAAPRNGCASNMLKLPQGISANQLAIIIPRLSADELLEYGVRNLKNWLKADPLVELTETNLLFFKFYTQEQRKDFFLRFNWNLITHPNLLQVLKEPMLQRLEIYQRVNDSVAKKAQLLKKLSEFVLGEGEQTHSPEIAQRLEYLSSVLSDWKHFAQNGIERHRFATPPPIEFLDSITGEIMKDPVIDEDGDVYDRSTYEDMLQRDLVNHAVSLPDLKQRIEEWKIERR